jgi:hypothetical protein
MTSFISFSRKRYLISHNARSDWSNVCNKSVFRAVCDTGHVTVLSNEVSKQLLNLKHFQIPSLRKIVVYFYCSLCTAVSHPCHTAEERRETSLSITTRVSISEDRDVLHALAHFIASKYFFKLTNKEG